ncbi:MAG TPA: MlaD family protein [Alphaproteobacteria bacterium]
MTTANPKLVGAFVVGGVALLIGGIVAFGSMQFFKSHVTVVMSFEEDLSGLDPGAPVTFKGVQIGTVSDIALRFNTETKTFSSPVVVQIEPDRFQIEGARPRTGENLPYFVEQGLRARLASQSILTGKRLIELSFRPDTPARLSGVHPGQAEIPTIPSQMEALQAGVEGVFRKLDQMPLPELIGDLRVTTQTVTTLLSRIDPESLSAVAQEASATLQRGRDVLENINGRLDAIAPDGEAAIKNANRLFQELQRAATGVGPALASMQRAAERADRLLADAGGVIEPGSPTHRELMAMMREIGGAARSMRGFTDELDRNPNSLLFGKSSPKGR